MPTSTTINCRPEAFFDFHAPRRDEGPLPLRPVQIIALPLASLHSQRPSQRVQTKWWHFYYL